MISFVGLGNPGSIYAKTKHNAGFWVIDELCKRWKVSLNPGNGSYVFGEKNDSRAILMKPLTGMNKSGKAVKDFCINCYTLYKKYNRSSWHLYGHYCT